MMSGLKAKTHLRPSAVVSLPVFVVSLPVFVDQSVEGHAISPAGGKVVDVNIRIPKEREDVTYDECGRGASHVRPQSGR